LASSIRKPFGRLTARGEGEHDSWRTDSEDAMDQAKTATLFDLGRQLTTRDIANAINKADGPRSATPNSAPTTQRIRKLPAARR
jgi:hypothetical protein